MMAHRCTHKSAASKVPGQERASTSGSIVSWPREDLVDRLDKAVDKKQ